MVAHRTKEGGKRGKLHTSSQSTSSIHFLHSVRIPGEAQALGGHTLSRETSAAKQHEIKKVQQARHTARIYMCKGVEPGLHMLSSGRGNQFAAAAGVNSSANSLTGASYAYGKSYIPTIHKNCSTTIAPTPIAHHLRRVKQFQPGEVQRASFSRPDLSPAFSDLSTVHSTASSSTTPALNCPNIKRDMEFVRDCTPCTQFASRSRASGPAAPGAAAAALHQEWLGPIHAVMVGNHSSDHSRVLGAGAASWVTSGKSATTTLPQAVNSESCGGSHAEAQEAGFLQSNLLLERKGFSF